MKSEIAIAVVAVCAVLIVGWFSRPCGSGKPWESGLTIGGVTLAAGCRASP